MEKRTDKYGRVIWGSGPDRTCLKCYTGFSFDTMSKEGLSPCCASFDHAAFLWLDGVEVPPKEFFPIPEGEGLWAKLNKVDMIKNVPKKDLQEAIYEFFTHKPMKMKEQFPKKTKYRLTTSNNKTIPPPDTIELAPETFEDDEVEKINILGKRAFLFEFSLVSYKKCKVISTRDSGFFWIYEKIEN